MSDLCCTIKIDCLLPVESFMNCQLSPKIWATWRDLETMDYQQSCHFLLSDCNGGSIQGACLQWITMVTLCHVLSIVFEKWHCYVISRDKAETDICCGRLKTRPCKNALSEWVKLVVLSLSMSGQLYHVPTWLIYMSVWCRGNIQENHDVVLAVNPKISSKGGIKDLV